MKNKKIIISAVVLVVIAIIVAVIILNSNNSQEEHKIQDDGISKMQNIQSKILEKEKYIVNFYLNDENYKKIARNGESARIEISDEGEKKTYVIKNNNTYLLIESTNQQYEYQNNVSMLNGFEKNISDLLQKNYVFGTETIEDKEYGYEEYSEFSAFLINYKGNVSNSNTKTRLYFDGNDLKYIKTYVGSNEQLLKVDLEFKD